ncbi:ABC transporter permease [Chloroflexota bacterium]
MGPITSNFTTGWRKFKKHILNVRFRRYPIIPIIIVLSFIIMATFAPLLTQYDPDAIDLAHNLQPPFWEEGGSMNHPLGTDMIGRDVLSRIYYGARISLLIVVFCLAVGGGFGLLLGVIAGYKGGWVDTILMRAADATMAFPIIFIALLLAVAFGPNMMNVIIACGVILWARFARVVRGEVLSLRERDYVALAKVGGVSTIKIMAKHIFPNVLNTLMVMLTLQVGWVILVESTLSFLGAGIPPPTATWGAMVARGREYLGTAWWLTTIPGFTILIVVLGFNLFGDWLREALDPKMRQID